MNNANVLSSDVAAKILLIGNIRFEENRIDKMLVNAGYHCYFAANSQHASELLRYEPDVLMISHEIILSSELQALRNSVKTYLPVIAIAKNADAVLPDEHRRPEIDGFLLSPINPQLLKLTLDSAIRLGHLYRQLAVQRQQLINYQHQIDLEREVAAKIYENVLQSKCLDTEVVSSFMSPMALFKGDLLLVEKTPDDHLYLLLGDFTGHGLSALVAATPVANIFYGMARKGFALADIVREINAKLHKMLPVNRFLAATAVALYPDSKTLSLITCGLPEHVLVDDRTASYKVIKSKNIPLGIDRSIERVEQNFSVTKHHHLFLATHGTFDAENVDGEAFGFDRVVDAVSKQPSAGFDVLKAELERHIQGLEQQDEISFIELLCDVENVPWQSNGTEREMRSVQALNWKTFMEFNIDALRVLNPVPVIVDALMEIQGLQQHRQAIFLIITELFANALDHGVLGLDSAIKATPEGFMRFYQLKEERIQTIQQGKIRLSFVHEPTESGGRLTVKVTDSGEGFDWQARLQNLEKNTAFAGRGLKLLETLCTRLSFHGKGNRVTALFDWHN